MYRVSQVSEMATYSEAREHEKRGEYRQASASYARLAFDDLVEANFEPTRQTRLAIGHLLEAISCDSIAENQFRAQQLQIFSEQILTIVQEDTDELALEGLTYEWIGDSYLFVGSPVAIGKYDTAREIYEGLSDVPQRGWGMEEEFDYAYWAFESFIDSKGYSIPAHLEIDFTNRIQFKLKVAEEVLSI